MGWLASTDVVDRLVWLSAPPPWVTFVVLLASLLSALWLYGRERPRLSTGRQWILVGLRLGVLAAVLLMLYQPVVTTTRVEERPSVVAVLVDTSVSMTLRDKLTQPRSLSELAQAVGVSPQRVNDLTRLQLIQGALGRAKGQVVAELCAGHQVRFYQFGAKTRAVATLELHGKGEAAAREAQVAAALESISALEASGSETALGDALKRVSGDLRGHNVAAVVVLSDGRSNAGGITAQSMASYLGNRGIPIVAVAVGNAQDPVDIAVSDLDAAPMVIAGDDLPVKVDLAVSGIDVPTYDVELTVKLGDDVVHTELVSVRVGQRQQVAVNLRPQTPGDYTLIVSVPVDPAELVGDNNSVSQSIRVVDKRIRVLYVDTLPRYEYRYLRWGLVRDRNMEAQVFQISADPETVHDTSPGVAPLVRVPQTREELFSYHVIVLGDVDPFGLQLGSERLRLIREFVEDYGGGLLLIAGEHFMPRSYAQTPLEALLPVRLAAGSADPGFGSAPITTGYVPKRTRDGRRHALMRLLSDPEQNSELWDQDRLPAFYWFHRARETKPAARVLAVHPEARTLKGEPVPIFAFQAVGAGMTFYSATDDVWRWRAGVGSRYTYRFWAQVIRFLATGRLLASKRFALASDRLRYNLGETALLFAQVRDSRLKPVKDPTVSLVLNKPDGGGQQLVLEAVASAPGSYQGQFVAPAQGRYTMRFGDEYGEVAAGVSHSFDVTLPDLEKSDPRTDEALLQALARESGGQFVRLAEVAKVAGLIDPVRERVELPLAERSLWDSAWAVIVLVSLLGLEWVLRKRWNLL